MNVCGRGVPILAHFLPDPAPKPPFSALSSQGNVEMIKALYFLFVLSGAAGLIYESIWTRYLGLFVGHDPFGQNIVLGNLQGGMSAGAMLVSRWTTRLKE